MAKNEMLDSAFSRVATCLRSVLCYEHRVKRDDENNWKEPGACLDCKIADLERLVGLLDVAKCPNCDGSGSYSGADTYGEEVQIQCQWCFEKATLVEKERLS